MEKPGRIFVSQSISFPPGLLAEAKERCAKLGLSFSAYVQKCIERDLTERGAIVYQERADDRLASAGKKPAGTPPGAASRTPRRR